MVKPAILGGPGRVAVDGAPGGETRPGEVVCRGGGCRVFTAEVDVGEGKTGNAGLPRAIGHEASGVVDRVGPGVERVREGDRVAVWATRGGFGEYVVVRAEHCFPAGDVPLDLALGEPLACAVNAVELAAPVLADDVVVIGAGFMGNLVQQLVHLRGPRRVIVADTRPDALDRARRLGTDRIVDVTRESLKDAVQEATDGRGADVTFEVAGTQGALTAAGEVTRMSGTVAIVGYHQGGDRALPLAYWNWMAFKIANAHFREEATILRGMRTGMRLLTAGRLSLAELVTHRFPLDQIDRAFATAHAKPPGFAKATVVLTPNA